MPHLKQSFDGNKKGEFRYFLIDYEFRYFLIDYEREHKDGIYHSSCLFSQFYPCMVSLASHVLLREQRVTCHQISAFIAERPMLSSLHI